MVLSYILQLRVPRSGTYIMKPTASCEAAQLWVRAILPPHIVPRRGTDASRMMLRKVGPALRDQEMVRGSLLIPQLRSFGACSGFLTDTCPLGTRRWLMSYYERLRGYGETPSDTIFAFLMLNTMSWAHNKIFGAKFLSFERLEPICLYTACYAVFWRSDLIQICFTRF